MDIKELQETIGTVFLNTFGRTSLTGRQKDILNEAFEVSRFTDLRNLRSELGQLLCSTLAGINECGWDAETLINETLNLIKSREAQYKSLSRKKKIALLGGAFDPPTLGHIQVAQFVLNASKEFDEVWLMPCYKHMYNKKLASPEHRLEMCRLATQTDGRLKVFDYEIKNELSGETYTTINRLLSEEISETHNFSVIIGQDNANSFDKWYNYEELVKLARFVVVPRKGVPVDFKTNWYLKQPHIYLQPDDEIMEVSSTMVRDHIKYNSGISILSQFIISPVRIYIDYYKLYRE